MVEDLMMLSYKVAAYVGSESAHYRCLNRATVFAQLLAYICLNTLLGEILYIYYILYFLLSPPLTLFFFLPG